jgi:hypothetical protein
LRAGAGNPHVFCGFGAFFGEFSFYCDISIHVAWKKNSGSGGAPLVAALGDYHHVVDNEGDTLPDAHVATKADCEEFWKLIETHMPAHYSKLAHAIKILLVLPSTEADCERLFSLMKRIVTDKRKSLSCENLEACCIVNLLYDLVCQGKMSLQLTTSANRGDLPGVSRLTCRAIVAYALAVRHNANIDAKRLDAKFKCDVQKALLWPNDDQPNFHNGTIRIQINRNEAAATRDALPLEYLEYRNPLPKAQRALRTKNQELQTKCAHCKILFSEHQGFVEGVEECIDCAACGKWFHGRCTSLNVQAYCLLAVEVKKQCEEFDAGTRTKIDRKYECRECRSRSRRRRRGEDDENGD